MAENLAGLAQRILAQPAPVVLLDSCAVLDIVRSPTRPEISSNVVQASIAMRTAASANPPGIWLVATELVAQEIAENLSPVEAEVSSRIADVDRVLEDVTIISQHLPTVPFPTNRVGALGLPAHLRGIAEAIIATACKLGLDDQCRLLAGARAAGGRPPSAKGRQQFKDCDILEHYLALGRRLRDAAYQAAVFFVSSNTADYGSPPGKVPPALQADFADAELTFVTTLDWANAWILNPPAPPPPPA